MHTSALTLHTQRPQKVSGDPYLKLHINPQTPVVFSMRHIQEALILPSRRLTPMPNMPACMVGLMNRRSRVLWVVDLAQLLGLSASYAMMQYNFQYNLVITQVGTVTLGLVVQQVEGITWIHPNSIHSPIGQVTSSLVPYLRGCILQQKEQKQEIVLVLDAEAIAQSPALYST